MRAKNHNCIREISSHKNKVAIKIVTRGYAFAILDEIHAQPVCKLFEYKSTQLNQQTPVNRGYTKKDENTICSENMTKAQKNTRNCPKARRLARRTVLIFLAGLAIKKS